MNDIEKQTEDTIRAALAPRLAAAKTRHEKTRETATLLFFQYGIYPSAKVVHGYTQHGSMTDINTDLREFWNDLRERSRVKIEAPMFPDAVTAMFSDALAKVWELAMDKAHAALDGERQEAADQVAQAQRDAYEAQRMRQIAESDAQSREYELRQERNRREVAEKKIDVQAAEIDALQSSLVQWQAQAEAEAQARKAALEQFSRDLESERAARQRDNEMFEGEIKFAKMQIEAARSTERDLREQIKEDKASKDVELAAYRQRASRAEDALGAARIELAEIKGRYAGLEERIVELQARIRELAKGSPRPAAIKPAAKRRLLRR
jgi:predicted  nucleic acid-binding Zn-ribbon protein